MNVRSIPIQRILRSSFCIQSIRTIQTTPRVLLAMDAGVTSEELENAIKTRLSAVHTQVNDISGHSPFVLG